MIISGFLALPVRCGWIIKSRNRVISQRK